MKKLACGIAVLALVTGVAMANSVTSLNAVGFVKVDVYSNFNMYAFSWNPVGAAGGGVSVQDLFNTDDLYGGGDFFSGDNIYFWDKTSQSYKFVYLYDSGGSFPTFDGKWYVFNPGFPDNDAEATNMISSGEALWLLHKSGDTNTALKGQVPVSSSNEFTLAGHATEDQFTLMGSAYSADLFLADVDWVPAYGGGDFFSGDNIYIWDASTQSYKFLYLYDSGGAFPTFDNKWYIFNPGFPDNDTEFTDPISVGQGFWYVNKDTSDITVWQEKPYTFGD